MGNYITRNALAIFLMLPLLGTPAFAQRTIDTEKSTLTVRVLKTGFFSAFGHEHEIGAPIESGTFDETKSTVELSVDARKLKVLDKDVSDKDRAEVQKTMLGPEVLDSEKLPEIRFRSTGVDPIADGQWIIRGDLTLHGQTHPVTVRVQNVNGRYQGKAEVKQKDFGITPVTVAGGAVKVKNEVRIEFDVVGK